MMRTIVMSVSMLGLLVASVAGGIARGQKAEEGKGGGSVEAINAEFETKLLELERARLRKLAALAKRQEPKEAQATYLAYFRTAIAEGLYEEAEEEADALLARSGVAPELVYLADVTALFAKVERGDYEASVQTLARAIRQGRDDEQAKAAAAEALPRAARVALVESYYQKLVQAEQFAVAKRAFGMIAEAAIDPAVKGLAKNRLERVERVGKPAPALAGQDVDGQEVSLASMKGDVVLVVFWATWAVPSVAEVGRLEQLYLSRRGQGFRVLGVNVDSLQEGGPGIEATRALVRRFLVDYNVPWPTLMNGEGKADFARIYGVREVPANFLVGRDGTIEAVDLTGASLEKAVEKALGR